MTIVEQYREQIRRFEAIEYAGLVLRPLTVSDYALFRKARAPMEIMLSSLPPAIARLNWCAALWAIDLDAAKHGQTAGFFAATMALLAAAARIQSFTDSATGKPYYPIKPLYSQNTGQLTAVAVETHGNAELLNMQQMDVIRQILAAQNGYRIPDENWNPELLSAARYTESQSTIRLSDDLDGLVFSVAAALGKRASELWDWPIWEFEGERKAINRRLLFQIYSQANLSGFVKFKNGNPFPSWEQDRTDGLPGDFKDINSIANREAKELLHDMTPNTAQEQNR